MCSVVVLRFSLGVRAVSGSVFLWSGGVNINLPAAARPMKKRSNNNVFVSCVWRSLPLRCRPCMVATSHNICHRTLNPKYPRDCCCRRPQSSIMFRSFVRFVPRLHVHGRVQNMQVIEDMTASGTGATHFSKGTHSACAVPLEQAPCNPCIRSANVGGRAFCRAYPLYLGLPW